LALRLGTRGSSLALAQSALVARSLETLGEQVELVEIVTSGDRARALGDKGRFVKEIEQALLEGEIDLAVHSAKDVPGELPDGLAIVGVPERADPRDALCGAASLDALPPGAVVGTASLRRRAQLLALRPDLDVRELRGNVDTRLRKLTEGAYDAVVLAAAGLSRLGRGEAGMPLSTETLVPAPGQGCLALEARTGDARIRGLAERLTNPSAMAALMAERALVTAIDATCHTPVGALATITGDSLRLCTFVGTPDGAAGIRGEVVGDVGEPAAVGAAAAQRLIAAGARDVLAAAEPGSHAFGS
jgi:hydroxymethylbilane synthase